MEPNANPARLNIQAEVFNPATEIMLQQRIREMVARAIDTQGREIIRSLVHPENNVLVDEVIEEQYRNDIADLDRIPDVVRCLREFSGNAAEYSSWKKNVDRILTLYENKRGTPKYFGIVSVIRNKITGNADQVLESYNTPLNWVAITKCLNTHYADKRDIGTLEYQMTMLVQGQDTVEQFYQRVYAHLSLILNKISCAEFGSEATQLLTRTYRDKALDTFQRGLHGDLPNLLAMREPTDLPQALQLCLKLQNQNFRANHANNVVQRNNNFRNKPPNLPPRRQTTNYQQQQYQQQPFHPQLAYMPRNSNTKHDGNPFVPTRPNNRIQNEEVVPMDVDQTMHTQRINYANRNAFNNTKRPASTNNTAPRKQQRTYNLCTSEATNENNVDFLELKSSSLPYFEVKTKSNKILKFLVDTGSTENYIQPSLVESAINNENKFTVQSIAGQAEIKQHKFLQLFNTTDKLKFFLLPTLESFHAILGNNSLKQLDAVIHTKESYMIIKNKIKIPLKEREYPSVNKIEIVDQKLTQNQIELLNKTAQKYTTLFADPNEKLPYTTKVVAKIRTNSDDVVYTKSYPYPVGLKAEVEQQINELLENNIIKPSRSPYNSPVHIVKKKCDSSGKQKYRTVIDFRKLNSVTIADRYPIPEVNEILSNLGKAKIFSILDLKSGFHQIPLAKRDREKTAFSINNGKYEFNRLPFGLKNAPAIFQRTLDDILRENIGQCCYVYMDDIIIYSTNEHEHIEHINKIFKTLNDANMRIQLDKCQFLKKEVEYLGFQISANGITSCPSKIEAIKKIQEPKTLKELRSFLGLSGFYRRFILNYAKVAKPLTVLLRGEDGKVSKNASKNKLIQFNEEATKAFNNIKNALISRDVILHHPDFTKAFELTTDASQYALGAVLSQEGRPISFISRTLTETEEHYASNEREMLAIVWSLNTFKNYLYGPVQVNIYTDHQSLTGALSQKNNNAKLKRWKAFLEEFNYTLHYKPGSTNVVADTMSRLPKAPQSFSMTLTEHTAESSAHGLILHVEAPLNVFRNQLIIQLGEKNAYKFQIVFPRIHRHTLIQEEYNNKNLLELLKKHLNPCVINGINTSESIMGKIQHLYRNNLSNYHIRFTNKTATDVTDEAAQEQLILQTHKRAHRNACENKQQILEAYYFPSMSRKIQKIVKLCEVCKKHKYDRSPNKPKFFHTPIPEHAGHTVHIDIFITEGNYVLTALDKFSKFAQARIILGKSMENLRPSLKELLFYFGIPKAVVVDNERALNAESIKFMLEDELGIEIYTTPPYRSSVNGQIERFHSTLIEIMRYIKTKNTHSSFSDLLYKAVNEYNHTYHSVTKQKPIDVFFGRKIPGNLEDFEKARKKNQAKIADKQQKDLKFHNKKRHKVKNYEIGEEIFVKQNKRIGSKLSQPYKKEIVKQNLNTTIITESGKVVHKAHIRN